MLCVNELIGFGAGGDSTRYWWTRVTLPRNGFWGQEYGRPFAVVAGDVYAVFKYDSDPEVAVACMSDMGVLSWKYGVAWNTPSSLYVPRDRHGVVVLGSVAYVLGSYDNNSNNRTHLVKISSAGVQLKKGFQTSAYPNSVGVNAAGNLVVANGSHFATIDTAGNLVHSRDANYKPQSGTRRGGYIDSDGTNLYLMAEQAPVSDTCIALGKWSDNISSGIVSAYGLSYGSGHLIPYFFRLNGGNFHVCGHLGASSLQYVLKATTSGVSWCRYSATSANSTYVMCAVDTAGNVYWVYYNGTSSRTEIVKFDSSGTELWKRYLSKTGYSPAGIDVQGSALYVALSVSSSKDQYLLKLPTDGTLTGTYDGITYAASTTTYTSLTSASFGTFSPTTANGNSVSITAETPDYVNKTPTITATNTAI